MKDVAAVKWQNLIPAKNYGLENIDYVVVYYCSIREQLNQIIFSFSLKLLTVRTSIICLRLLISGFIYINEKKSRLFVIFEM